MTEEKKDALTKTERHTMSLSGSYSDPATVSAKLQWAAKHMHLVSPAASVGHVPPGCTITLAAVQVDPENETYSVSGGKLALTKPALDRIAAGVGISWDANKSRRLDDGSDPHYCHYRAVGRYRAFDGQWMEIMGEKEMDMREGSATLESITQKAAAARKPRDPAKQIMEVRMHILAHAETKARLRAIRSIGLRSAYGKQELEKPFVMARVMFTGKSDDPEMQKELTRATAASFLDGASALYGEPAAAPALPAHEMEVHTPPPVDETKPSTYADEEPEDAEFDEEPPSDGDLY